MMFAVILPSSLSALLACSNLHDYLYTVYTTLVLYCLPLQRFSINIDSERDQRISGSIDNGQGG